MILDGKVWKYSRGISATDLLPARYDKLGMARDHAACARHLLEDVDPEFAGGLSPGDILVVDGVFGLGHAHYYAAGILALRAAGLGGVLASEINALFFRSSTDLGLKTWRFADLAALVNTGDRLEIDLATGRAINHSTGVSADYQPVPPLIRDIFSAPGSAAWARLNRASWAAA